MLPSEWIKALKSPLKSAREPVLITRSRNILYQTSANILLYYRKLMDYDLDKSDAIALLNSTFIKPDKVEVLFELYWTIKLIKYYSKDSKPKYLILDKGNNAVAKWEDDQYSYKIFHDSTGSYRFFESLDNIDLSKIDNEHIKRDINSKRKWIEFRKEIFKIESADGLWGGRPDIILEQYENNTSKLCRIIIGEVKYTQNENYA